LRPKCRSRSEGRCAHFRNLTLDFTAIGAAANHRAEGLLERWKRRVEVCPAFDGNRGNCAGGSQWKDTEP
jgi:hypothetical protein